MKTIEFDKHIANRPRVYAQLGFQRTLLLLFLTFGIIFFVNTGIIAVTSMFKYLLIDQVSHEISQTYSTVNKKAINALLTEHFEPIKYRAIAYSFFLSISFFIISRYCQKIINRNKYIIKLEEELKRTNI